MNGTTHGPGIDVAAPSRNRVGATGEWPRRSFLELGAVPGAVPCARLHARQVMWEWGLDALRDDTELVVSELVTKARGELDSQPPIPFLHDTTTKNVIVTPEGAFSGIVDVDDLCFGDPRYVVALTLPSLTAAAGRRTTRTRG